MKYLIIGNGWIGNRIHDFLAPDADLVEAKLSLETVQFLKLENYDVVINTVAKTNIDWCEKNRQEAFQINTLLALELAKKCAEAKKKYVFFSSACIFESAATAVFADGANLLPKFIESSIPNPQCFYALTKWIAEELIKEANPEALIVRPRLPISAVPHPRNTVNKLLSYQLINTNQESITVIEDMLPVLKELIEKNETGIVHLVNEYTASPAEIAKAFGHIFTEVSKVEQDKRLREEGRAKRVTTYVGSERVSLLPNVRERLPQLAEEYARAINPDTNSNK